MVILKDNVRFYDPFYSPPQSKEDRELLSVNCTEPITDVFGLPQDAKFRWTIHYQKVPFNKQSFNTHFCPGQHHPLTHVPGDISWCRGTSGYVWKLYHLPPDRRDADGRLQFYWAAIGEVFDTDMEAMFEFLTFRNRLLQGGVLTEEEPPS